MAKEKVSTLSNDEPHNQTELAESYGITQQTMNNYMRMAKMISHIAPKIIPNIEEGFYLENY